MRRACCVDAHQAGMVPSVHVGGVASRALTNINVLTQGLAKDIRFPDFGIGHSTCDKHDQALAVVDGCGRPHSLVPTWLRTAQRCGWSWCLTLAVRRSNGGGYIPNIWEQ